MSLLQELQINVAVYLKNESDLDNKKIASSIAEITNEMRQMSKEGITDLSWQPPYSKRVMLKVANHFTSLGIKATVITDHEDIVGYNFDWF